MQTIFGDRQYLKDASKDDLTHGLLSLHAFTEQSRYVKGGIAELPDVFWADNAYDFQRVRKSLLNLLYGSGDFVERLHDALYDPSYKLQHFAMFCGLELMGTVAPTTADKWAHVQSAPLHRF